MPNYRRVRVPGGSYFFTVNLLERRRTLLIDHIDSLRESFHDAQAARPYALLAWVILPDHLHCVWRLPDGDDDNGTRWRHIKSHFSRSIPSGNWKGTEAIKTLSCLLPISPVTPMTRLR